MRQVATGWSSSRRYPRFELDLDWFVESDGCSTLGRGLTLTVRGAKLPLSCASEFRGEVTLFVALPHLARMFQARCRAQHHDGRGWVLDFVEVSPEDLQALGHTLVTEFGVAALPELERRPLREVDLTRHRSTS
jgi:hypothetical protein